MRKIIVVLTLALFASPAFAASGVIKLSLWDRIAIAAPNNIDNVGGIDLGIGSTTGTLRGVQFDFIYSETRDAVGWTSGLINIGGDFTGLQGGFLTKVDDMTGVQWGLVHLSDRVKGLQVGFYNQAEDMTGLQFGFVNYAKNIYGLQLGFVNIAENGWLPAMVFINGRF